MPTEAERIATIKDQTLTRIEEVTASANPTYTIDGQTFKKGEYLKQLTDTKNWCDEQLDRLESTVPAEVVSTGYT